MRSLPGYFATLTIGLVMFLAGVPAHAQNSLCGSWVVVPTPVPPTGSFGSSSLEDVVVIAPDDIWAVGEIYMGSPDWETLSLAMHWDGIQWSTVPTPNPSWSINSLEAVAAVSSDDVWAAGLKEVFTPFAELHPFIIHWDGSTWEEVVDPDLAIWGGVIWTIEIVGPNDIWFGADRTLTFHWDGSNFQVRPVPTFDTGNCSGTAGCGHAIVDMAAVAPDDVWAVGGAGDGDYSFVSQIWHWDGSSWTHTPGPSIPYFQRLYGVVALASNDVWAVGDLTAADPDDTGMLIIHWDGSQWSRVATPLFTPEQGSLFDIVALAPNDIWAAGVYSETGEPGQPLTMRYDGSEWRQVMPDPAGPAGAWLRGISGGTCELWSVGTSGDDPFAQRFVPGSPAEIAATPAVFDVTVAPGEQTTLPLVIENLSDGVQGVSLDWSLTDVIPHPISGYTWVDSDDPAGPTFAWKDITAVGTSVFLFNDDSISVPLPFTFWFYGRPKTDVVIGSNGYLTFGIYGKVDWQTPFPDPAAPNDAIAGFWDNLDPSRGGSVHYYHDAAANEFIVQYTDIQSFFGGLPYTFEIILRPNGDILLQYLSMQGVLDSAGIGIENFNGTDGLQVVLNAPYVHDGLAVLFPGLGDPDWISSSPTAGSVPPQSSTTVDVVVDATELGGGTYQGNLVIASNDPDESITTIPVNLTVLGTTAVTPATPQGFRLHGNHPNPFNPVTTIRYELPSSERVRLAIHDSAGRLVRVLVDGKLQTAGEHSVTWDGGDARGFGVASGVYFFRIEAGAFEQAHRAVLVR